MSILHYTIGMPPERNGGSVQYAFDLIKEQSITEKILVLKCGDTLFRGNKVKIKKSGQLHEIPVYVLTNPLTPTLIYGSKEPVSQHRELSIDYENIKCFIEKNRIDILHLHTLMGLHKDVVKYIKSFGVKIVYTTHDFHGLCIHYNFIDNDGNLCQDINPAKCARCNIHEPSDLLLRVANSPLYHFSKNIGVFSTIKNLKWLLNHSGREIRYNVSSEKIEEYKGLISYYREYFGLIDKFHFNSKQTEAIFKQYISNIEGRVIPVITYGIKDNRSAVKPSDDIKLGYIGNTGDYKGFPLLKKVLKEFYDEGIRNLKILAYTELSPGTDTDCPLIEYQPPYRYQDISNVLYHLDGTIVPSKCYETFSLVALESLAHGRPAIVSDRVGAKDIVRTYAPEFVFSSEDELKSIFRNLLDNPECLSQVSTRILSQTWNYNLPTHTKEIIDFYYK